MLRKGLLIFLIVAISVSLVFAGNTKDNRKVQGNLRPADPHMVYPINPGDQVVQKTPINTDDPIGVVFDLGDTWYDIQHNSTCGRQINVDAEGYVQIGWMNGFQEGATDRHIFYNAVDPSNNNMFGVGIPVDQAQHDDGLPALRRLRARARAARGEGGAGRARAVLVAA